jgi:hypothetical protein
MQKRIQPRIPWSREWAQATDSFLQNHLEPHSEEEIRHRSTDAIIANDARKLGRFIYPIRELRRAALLEILSSPRHLAKVAAKAKRHAEIYAALPVFDPESD